MCFCRVSVCLSVRVCVCLPLLVPRAEPYDECASERKLQFACVRAKHLFVCLMCVCQGVCEGVRASNEHRYGSVPTQTLEPQAPSPAKYAIKNFTLEHANYEARQLAAAAATGLRVCIAMAILVSVHIFIATFLHGFVFLDSAKC